MPAPASSSKIVMLEIAAWAWCAFNRLMTLGAGADGEGLLSIGRPEADGIT
jgi:hypothetical protein